MSQAVVKVSTLVHYLKSKLDQDNYLQRILVSGEISNFIQHRSGHWYFTIKDETSRIGCVMFASSSSRSKYIPKDGDKIVVQANTSVFETSGQLQLYVTGIKKDGIGDYHIQFERLKQKLFEEGYFDESHKQACPQYPMKIGLVTGKNTAAREDVVSTLARRWPVAQLIEIPTLVQGEGASAQIIVALDQMQKQQVDVILLVRGGGSIEDLWAFNDELLAHCIYRCTIPIITGVGHEIDTTIADYVSDKRAPTPTGACEMATPDIKEVQQKLGHLKSVLLQKMNSDMTLTREKLNYFIKLPILNDPQTIVEYRKMKVDYLVNRLQVATFQSQKKRLELQQASQSFKVLVSKKIHQVDSQLTSTSHNITQLMQTSLENRKTNIRNTIQLLEAYSPLQILKRGYSITSAENCILHSIHDVSCNDEIKIRLSDGKIHATINGKESFDDKQENI